MDNIILFLNNLGQSFVGFATAMLVQASVLIIILLALDFVLRKKVRAVFRYCIWMLLLVKLLLPTTLSLPTGIGYWYSFEFSPATHLVLPDKPTKITTEQADAIAAQYGLEHLPSAPKLLGAEVRTEIPAITSDGWYLPPINPNDSAPIAFTASIQPTSITWQSIIFLAWLAVTITMILLLVQRMFFVRGLIGQSRNAQGHIVDMLEKCCRQMSIRNRITIKLSPNTISPSVCGLWRPTILIPGHLTEKLSHSQLKAVLIHELAHIKRGDLWLSLAQTILQIAYFYNPLLWIANAVIRRVREQAVDEMAMVTLGTDADNYPDTLVNIFKLAFKRPALSLRLIGVVESKSFLSQRIFHLINRPTPRSAKISVVNLAVIFVLAVIFLPMAQAKTLKTPTANTNIANPTPSTTALGNIINTLVFNMQFPRNASAVYKVERRKKDVLNRIFKCEYIFQDNKYRWGIKTLEAEDPKNNLEYDAYFDGYKTTLWYPKTNRGDIWEGRVNIPLYRLERYSFSKIAPKLMDFDVKVIGTEVIHDVPCMILYSKGYTSEGYRLWVPKDSPVYPLKIEKLFNKRVICSYEVEKLRSWNGVLFPEKITYIINQFIKETGEVIPSIFEHMTLLSFNPGIEVDPTEFELDFPSGAPVANHTSRTFYRVLPDGTFEEKGKFKD